MEPTCPRCHTTVRATDYYCFNCGKSLKQAPLLTDNTTIVGFFLKVLLLPPLGIVWGINYIKQKDDRSKFVGIAAIVITIIELVLVVQWTLSILNGVNSQMNSLQGIGF